MHEQFDILQGITELREAACTRINSKSRDDSRRVTTPLRFQLNIGRAGFGITARAGHGAAPSDRARETVPLRVVRRIYDTADLGST